MAPRWTASGLLCLATYPVATPAIASAHSIDHQLSFAIPNAPGYKADAVTSAWLVPPSASYHSRPGTLQRAARSSSREHQHAPDFVGSAASPVLGVGRGCDGLAPRGWLRADRKAATSALESRPISGENEELESAEGFLREALRMSDPQIQRTMERWQGLRVGAARDAVAFLCGGELDVNTHQMRSLVLKTPQILEAPVPETLAPRTDRWLRKAGLGLTPKDLRTMVVTCPEVLLLDYDSVLGPIVLWLLVDVCVPRNRVAKLLVPSPHLLTLGLDTELRPKGRWLTEYLQLTAKDARRVIMLAPEVLNASMEETLLPACDWLMGAARCDAVGLGRIVARSPELLTMDPGVMGEWFAELAAALFKGDREEASAFLSCQPLLLTESERLRPLVRLLTEELKATLPQAREVIANDPSILEFDMAGRVFPRLEAVRNAGIEDVVNGAVLPLGGKMKVLGKFSEARFAKWLRREKSAVEAVSRCRGSEGNGAVVGGGRGTW